MRKTKSQLAHLNDAHPRHWGTLNDSTLKKWLVQFKWMSLFQGKRWGVKWHRGFEVLWLVGLLHMTEFLLGAWAHSGGESPPFWKGDAESPTSEVYLAWKCQSWCQACMSDKLCWMAKLIRECRCNPATLRFQQIVVDGTSVSESRLRLISCYIEHETKFAWLLDWLSSEGLC